jgi:hypothetical protein
MSKSDYVNEYIDLMTKNFKDNCCLGQNKPIDSPKLILKPSAPNLVPISESMSRDIHDVDTDSYIIDFYTYSDSVLNFETKQSKNPVHYSANSSTNSSRNHSRTSSMDSTFTFITLNSYY